MGTRFIQRSGIALVFTGVKAVEDFGRDGYAFQDLDGEEREVFELPRGLDGSTRDWLSIASSSSGIVVFILFYFVRQSEGAKSQTPQSRESSECLEIDGAIAAAPEHGSTV
jgi:hypothetical protein